MPDPAHRPKPEEVTRLLYQIRDGDPTAFDRLMPLVYDALKPIARNQLQRGNAGHTLNTTDLVHETYLKMAHQATVHWENRAHFYGVAARAMRQILVDYARKRHAEKRGGGREHFTLTNRHLAFEIRTSDLLALDQALDRLNALNERLRKVVELRFFGGMTEEEIADVLEVSTRTVERDWVKARLFLHRELYPEKTP